MLPVALQPLKVASKNEHRVNVQLRKAASVCDDTLNRTPRNVQSVNVDPRFTSSVMSTSTNRTLAKDSPSRSWASHSRDLIVRVVGGACSPCFLSAMFQAYVRSG